MTLLQTACRVRKWNNFENWAITGKDIDKNKEAHFFMALSVYDWPDCEPAVRPVVECRNQVIWHVQWLARFHLNSTQQKHTQQHFTLTTHPDFGNLFRNLMNSHTAISKKPDLETITSSECHCLTGPYLQITPGEHSVWIFVKLQPLLNKLKTADVSAITGAFFRWISVWHHHHQTDIQEKSDKTCSIKIISQESHSKLLQTGCPPITKLTARVAATEQWYNTQPVDIIHTTRTFAFMSLEYVPRDLVAPIIELFRSFLYVVSRKLPDRWVSQANRKTGIMKLLSRHELWNASQIPAKPLK